MDSQKEYTYKYPRPAITVDCVIFGFDKDLLQLKVLLTKQGIAPYIGMWTFPGGFINIDETADECARRKLKEEVGLEDIFLEQLYTFSKIERDPRERIISIAYYALVRSTDHILDMGLNIEDVEWFSLSDIPKLAFEHQEIFNVAIERLRGKIRYQPIGFELLPERFTLPELHRLYETILQREIDRGNFRKKILSMNLLLDHSDKQKNRPLRGARIYSFDKNRYASLTKSGFYFEI